MTGKNKKKKKLRVAFRKNRRKGSRATDLTREIREEGLDRDEAQSERVGRGEMTRHRTIIVDEEPGGALRRDIDVSKCLPGRVISATGLHSLVQADDGRRFRCSVRRVVRMLARDERNAVATGDRVLFQPTSPDEGVVERVEPRHGVLARTSKHQSHVIVANVDQVLIVVSAADPPLKPGLVDRFLISAEKGEVGALVCINKTDLVAPARLQPVAGLYGRLGYDVVLTSVAAMTGIARLRSLLKGRQTVLSGQSGVGKSSLLNAVQPGLALATGEVGAWTRKGRHTTRRTELMQLDFGGWVVDTPGIRQFALWDVFREEVEGYFVEFRPFVPHCRFPDCLHLQEEGCGVKRAVALDLVSPLRYESYLRIVTGEEV